MNNASIRQYANTDREGHSCMSLQDQVNAWANLTNDGYDSPAVRQLALMPTFDGQKVDLSFIAACIQLGTGNCQKMLDSGRCSGFSDINGTTICNMVQNARAKAAPNCQDGQAVCGPSGPRDFPAPSGVAGNPPPASSANIIVGPADVCRRLLRRHHQPQLRPESSVSVGAMSAISLCLFSDLAQTRGIERALQKRTGVDMTDGE
ncbi:hypothetical protein [Bradyrhizobium sp. CCGUVB23]|uniref:hypothetical protein n=1 Tax=Bradyrhizobium sp. CCGUVB23 TaxID=2949630 RepID=UPI0020B2783F|nr:hypothetical protein [Bradyrhizobium sp. CCGUVB23]MCP3468563.1 hypothetical protein [Bradyrhizobium sp. CCGUVB23]